MGLGWRRGFAGWKSAGWEQISDFYLATPAGERIVETPHGKLCLSGSFPGINAIAAIVAARAINAPARQWEVRGFRPDENWATTLTLWSKTQCWFAPMISFALFGSIGALMLMPDSTPRRAAPVSLGLGWNIALVAMLLLTIVPFGLGLMWALTQLWCERSVLTG